MSRWTDFINTPKSCVIAAAGHGKTYAISECLEELSQSVQKPVLILTHTHAGVASIKKKIKERHIPQETYQIETITSFAQRYALSFVVDTSIFPDQEKDEYFPRIQAEAKSILAKPSVQKIVHFSYSHLFVDEYQDCSLTQHEIILSLATVLPTHIFGDPLQAIFNFDGEPKVDFTQHLSDFARFDLLETPWRWRVNGNCQGLGDKIFSIRESLSTNRPISMTSEARANLQVLIRVDEMSNRNQDYFSSIRSIVNSFHTDSTLIIVPSYRDGQNRLYGTISDRIALQQRIDFERDFALIEAIDAKSYYYLARNVDDLISGVNRARKKVTKIKGVIDGFDFNTTDVDPWFNDNIVCDRRGVNKEPSAILKSRVDSFISNPSLTAFKSILEFFYKQQRYRSKRQDLFHSLLKCIDEAIASGDSVSQCMLRYKNRVRRNGRKIEGKCIGTTLLTKGLEFDNVIVLDAHRFADKQNFYVAISRACKNLVIITKQQNLNFV